MVDNSIRDAKIAVALISTIGTLVVIIMWGATMFTAFLNLMGFTSMNVNDYLLGNYEFEFGEYALGFLVVRLPVILAILGVGFARFTNEYVDIRNKRNFVARTHLPCLGSRRFTLYGWCVRDGIPRGKFVYCL